MDKSVDLQTQIFELKTIDNDDKFLREKSAEVLFDDDSYKSIIDELKSFCIKKDSFAMSAIQLGISKQIIYFYQNETSIIDKVIINPRIIGRSGKAQYWEACISVPNKIGLVERPYEIEVEYFDIYGKKIKDTFKGLDSTIISHELDHLNGILYIDKAKEIKNMTKEARVEFRNRNPYRIISK